MRPYETMVIFDTAADEAAVNGVLERALGALRAKGGNPGRVERWGKRTFAYELHHKREGYYVVIELTAEPAGRGRHGADLRAGRRGPPPQGHAAARTRWPAAGPRSLPPRPVPPPQRRAEPWPTETQ